MATLPPGLDEAKRLGYSLTTYSGNRQRADYIKAGLILTVYAAKEVHQDQTANLSFSNGLIEVIINNFGFPNSNFWIFEKRLLRLYSLIQENHGLL